jgi:hypothetical protein
VTREEQQELAAVLARNFAEAYLNRASHAPAHWDGHELRRLLWDTAAEDFTTHMDRARVRAYNNDRATIGNL